MKLCASCASGDRRTFEAANRADEREKGDSRRVGGVHTSYELTRPTSRRTSGQLPFCFETARILRSSESTGDSLSVSSFTDPSRTVPVKFVTKVGMGCV